MKRNFTLTAVAGCALAAWIAKTALAGIIYATAAFFTREGWERWKSRKKFWG